MPSWLHPTGPGTAALTQKVRSISCEAVVENGIIRKDKPPRKTKADCPPRTTNRSFPQGHLTFSSAEGCKPVHISMTMNWNDISALGLTVAA